MDGLQLAFDVKSITATQGYMRAVKERILAGVRVGMNEGMQMLAEATVSEMHAAGIQNRSGALEANILASPRITESPDAIRGRVMAVSLVKAKGGDLYYNNLGNMLNLGAHEPKVEAPIHEIAEPDGETFWARGHVAFDIKPHPFFRRAVAVAEAPIMDVIRARISEAID